VQYYCNPNYPLLGVESHHKQHEEYKNLHGLVLSHNLAFSDGCWPCEIHVSAPLYVTLVPEVGIQWKKRRIAAVAATASDSLYNVLSSEV